MSGSGRKSHYRKSVTDEFLHGLPTPEDDDVICRAVTSRGANLFEIELGNGKLELAILPNKFKKLIWVKRGDYLIASSSQNDCTTSTGDDGKVKYLIKNILNKDQVKHIQSLGLWPEEFVIEEVKKESYDGMPDYDTSESECEYEDDEPEVDSMGNYILKQGDDDEEEESSSQNI